MEFAPGLIEIANGLKRIASLFHLGPRPFDEALSPEWSATERRGMC